jgi:hypothetical protein
MIISVTERAEYRRCRRRWNLGSSNRQGLTKLVPNNALALGTLIHAALADWLVHPELNLRNVFLVRAKQQIELVRGIYHKQTGRDLTTDELGSLWDAVNLGSAMMENYQEHWKTPLPDGFELISPEQRCQIPIPGTSHFLEGRLDAIIRELTGQHRLYVLEHKTYSVRPDEDTLKITDQFIAYQWMLTKLDMGQVAGVAYDGLWKRAAPPKKVENRAGVLSDLFARVRLYRTHNELTEFEQQLALEAREMASNPAIYMNRTWDGSCKWGCEYNTLCFAMSHGEDTDALKVRLYTTKEAMGITPLSEE